MILDVMLPKMTGLDVCKQLRADGNSVPIIMLTARGQEIDKVLGLKLGADDYVTKPFGFMELMARVEAVLRRGAGRAAAARRATPLRRRRRSTSRATRRSSAGEPLELSPREFRLLAFFARHRGEVVTRETLLDEVWDYNAIRLHPHRRHAHRQAAQEDRGRSRTTPATSHRAPAGLQVHRVEGRPRNRRLPVGADAQRPGHPCQATVERGDAIAAQGQTRR